MSHSSEVGRLFFNAPRRRRHADHNNHRPVNQKTPSTTTPSTKTPSNRDLGAANIEPPPWLDPGQWPFPLHRIDDVTYTEAGEGPTVVMVHVGMWSFIWRDLVAILSSDFRCVVIDAPGTGFSDTDGKATIADAAAAVTTIVESLDLDDLTLIFHDLGGTAALDAAADWPHRIRGLVAVNTFGWRPSGALFRLMLTIMGSRTMQGVDAVTGWLPRMTSTRFGVGRHLSRPDRRAFRRGMRRRGRAAFHRYMRSVRRHDYGRVDRATRALADRPILTVFGENNDPLGFQPQWTERFVDIDQLEIPDGNHFPMCDDPGGVAAAITKFATRR